MEKINTAYCAGLFEGEGNINTETSEIRDNRKISIIIKMTDREPLDMFQYMTGLGKVYGPYESGRSVNSQKIWKPHYVYKVTGYSNVQYIVCNLWSWLGPRRKEQIKLALTKYISFKSRNRQLRESYQAGGVASVPQ
jgi:hypothetical protein